MPERGLKRKQKGVENKSQSQALILNEILSDISNFYYSPEKFVKYSFRWDESPLAGEETIEDWAIKLFRDIEKHLCTENSKPLKIAIRAGHSVGKTTTINQILLWYISTRINPQIVVTANTRHQLNSKTWRELSKWHKLMVHSDIFEWTATQFYLKNHKSTWCANALAWSKENPEAFAGTHEEHVLIIFDEASGIDNAIWEVTEGALAYGEVIFIAVGNPTRTSGRFYEIFTKEDNGWLKYTIDSRTCKHSNKEVISNWIKTYGEDSDFVRVRVKGLPPKKGINQIVTDEMARTAMFTRYTPSQYKGLPKIMGVDIARYGDDKTAIAIRQGLQFLSLETYNGLDTTSIAEIIAKKVITENIDLIFIDLGYNPGVYDILTRMRIENVYGVHFGGKNMMDEKEKELYSNMASLMYYRFKKHIEMGGNIPMDEDLLEEIIGREYSYDTTGRILLESKEDLKRRLNRSPDKADACALTFASETLENRYIRDAINIDSHQQHNITDFNPYNF